MKSIPHNLTTVRVDSRWYLAAESTDERFVFLDSFTGKKTVYTAADGWTWADAVTFHEHMMRWPPHYIDKLDPQAYLLYPLPQP